MSFVICPIFWWWIGTELFFTSSSRKLNVSYMFFEDIFYVIDLTCYLKVWLHHIHISIQWLNCDLKHAFITVLRLVTPSYGTSVECIYFSWCNKLFEILHRVKIILHQFLYEGFFMHNLPSVRSSTIEKKMTFVGICLLLNISEAIHDTFANFFKDFCNLSAQPVRYLFFIIKNMSHMKILNKSGFIIKL